MLPIYNKLNQALINYYQHPDWDLLNITDPDEKIKILYELAEDCINSPILHSQEDSIDIPDDVSNIDALGDQIIGYVIDVQVDEKEFCLQITGRIFVKILLEIYKDTENNRFGYGDTCLLTNYSKTKEMFKISERLEQQIAALKMSENENIAMGVNTDDIS